MEKRITRYKDVDGNVFVLKFAVRHPLIEEVKASPAGCIRENGKLYVCYNHPFKPGMLGLKRIE